MSLDVAALLDRAGKARPASPARKLGRWMPLLPVFLQLRDRSFTCAGAIEWLQTQGAVPAGEEKRALNALQVLASRRRRQTAARLRNS